MKIKKLYIFLIFIVFVGCNNENTSIKSNKKQNNVQEKISLPQALMNLPIELKVWNEPDVIRASLNPKDTVMYKWCLQTFVKSESDQDIKIIEFGDYELIDNKTWKLHNYTGYPFDANNFCSWYFLVENENFTWKNAKKAIIHPGETYVDMSNWTNKSDSLTRQQGIWYFIGEKTDGSKVVGYTFYKNLPELL